MAADQPEALRSTLTAVEWLAARHEDDVTGADDSTQTFAEAFSADDPEELANLALGMVNVAEMLLWWAAEQQRRPPTAILAQIADKLRGQLNEAD